MSTALSEWPRTCSISGGSNSVFTGTSTPPASATPKAASTHSGRFPISSATRVPFPTPVAARALAKRRARAPSPSYVHRTTVPWPAS